MHSFGLFVGQIDVVILADIIKGFAPETMIRYSATHRC
jgi:hypothetical protein